jgi:hypothetical protein
MSDRPDQLLFTYGSLQHPEIQLDTFGRLIAGEEDVLSGYTVDYIEIDDPRALDASRPTVQPIVRATGSPRDKVTGLVLAVTEDELEAADEYQNALYTRGAVTLGSGRDAWVYLSA